MSYQQIDAFEVNKSFTGIAETIFAYTGHSAKSAKIITHKIFTKRKFHRYSFERKLHWQGIKKIHE